MMTPNQTHYYRNRPALLSGTFSLSVSFVGVQIIVVFLLLFLSFSTLAQNPSYYQFNTDNGLPSNETYKIIEDVNGYIWIATDRGVVRYDGYEFETFTTEDGLSNNVIFWMYEDYKGRIWFSGIDNSLCYFEDDIFFEHPSTEKLRNAKNRIILSIYVGSDDVVWIGSYGREPMVKLFPSGDMQEVLVNNVENQDILVFKMYASNIIFGVHINDSEIPSQKKIFVYDKDISLRHVNKIPSEFGDHLSSLIYKDDVIYFTNGRSIYSFNGTDSNQFVHPDKTYTNSLFQSNNGNLWVGLKYGGVGRFIGSEIKSNIKYFLEDWTVSSVYEDREGGLWFSTTDAGVFYYPSRTIESLDLFKDKITDIKHTKELVWAIDSDYFIYEITEVNGEYDFKKLDLEIEGIPNTYVDFESNFWISNGLPAQSNGNTGSTIKPRFELPFKHMIRLQDSTLWTCNRSEIKRMSWPNFTINECISIPSQIKRPKALKSLSHDELLLAGYSGLWSIKNGEINRYKYHNEIFEYRINDLEVLDNKDIVIASLGEGITRMDKQGNLRQITKKDGLLSSLVNCCYTLPGDSITWVGTSSGLSQINWLPNHLDSVSILNFTIFNGLNSNEILALDYVGDKLWVGTAKGITVIDPDDFGSLKKKPLIHMESIHINGELTKDTSTFFLSTNDFVKIHFRGISMNSKGNMSYRYHIKGFDESWENISNRVLEFKLFTPGEYELEIYSVNASGVVSSNSILRKFVVLPAFWQTWWFLASVVLFLILLIGFIFNRRYKIKQRENYLLTRSLETEQEALSSQITPHFLFNSLNSIQNLYQSNQSKNAVLHLANFSWLMRRILQNVKQHSVILSDELETLRLYMDLEVLRLNNNFSYCVKLGPDVDVDFVRIPPMIIQPFIENSIWHGILNKPDQNGNITIDFSIEGDNLRIEVLDDGVGRQKANELKSNIPTFRKSTGLKSIKRRMEVLNEMYKTNLNFDIIDLKDHLDNALGTKIIINIPLDYA